MSFAGLKKQMNKANQFLSEKMAGVKGTGKDDSFAEMEKRVDTCSKFIDEMMNKTMDFLQPNPTLRAKLATVHTFNKIQGKAKPVTYPHPEGQLASIMSKHGHDLGETTTFGAALVESADCYRRLAEIKHTMEEEVKQQCLDPMHGLQTREVKEINHHRKKLEGRRLDYDCKKRNKDKEGSKMPDEELNEAKKKYEESMSQATDAMTNFLDSDVELIQAMSAFIHAQHAYHRQAAELLEHLGEVLDAKRSDSQARPRSVYNPPRKTSWSGSDTSASGSASATGSHGVLPGAPGSSSSGPAVALPTSASVKVDKPAFSIKGKYERKEQTPTCRALFDFEAENPNELSFMEGDTIKLIEQVDENWFLGEIHGKRGHFPVNYAEILVPLPED